MKKKLFSYLTFLVFINIISSMFLLTNSVDAKELMQTYNNNTFYDLILRNNSSLILKNENIIFNITNDVKTTYENVSDYKNIVSMDYTFYNDSPKDTNETFYLNMKKAKTISFKHFDYEKKDFIYLDDKELYSVPDGKYRYIYDDNYYSIDDIKDTYTYSYFLNNNTNIYQYTLKVNKDDIKDVTYSSQSSVYEKLFGYKSYNIKENLCTYDFVLTENNTFTVYFINGYLDDFLTSLSVPFSDVSIIDNKTFKFEDLVFNYYDETKGVSKIDYSNAIYKKIDKYFYNCDNVRFFDIYDSLTCFYKLDINVKANSIYNLSITRPIYPLIETNYNYDEDVNYYSYTYSYDSSMFKINKENVNVKVINDGYIIKSSLNDLSSSFISLNENTFSFTTSFNENYNVDPGWGYAIYAIFLIFSIIGFAFVAFILVGMLVALIAICPNGRRTFNNLSSEFKKLKTFYIIEGVLELLLTFDLTIYTLFGRLANLYLPLILASLVLVMVLIEIIKYKQKHYVKLAFSIIVLISSILSLFIHYFSLISLVLNIVLYIIDLGSIDRYKKNYCDKVEKTTTLKEKIEYYPVNILTNKENVILKVALIIIVCIALFIFDVSPLGIVYAVLFIFLTFFIINLIIQIHNQKDFINFTKDLDYLKLKRNVLNKLKDKRINIETKDIYILRLSEIALCYSLKDFKELMASLNNVNNLKIKRCKDLMELNYLLNQDDFINKANELKIKYKKIAKRIDRFVDKWKYVYSSINDDKILKKFPFTTKNNFVNATNLFVLINHYRNNNEIIKENELYNLFKEKYSSITLLNDMLEGIDIRLRYKELINNEKINCKYCNATIDKFLLKCPYCDNENKEDYNEQ